MRFEYDERFYRPESSLVSSVSYNRDTREMVVALSAHAGLSRYLYEGVTPADFHDFRTASSAGNYYNRAVKRRFKSSPLGVVEFFQKPQTVAPVQKAADQTDRFVLTWVYEGREFTYEADTRNVAEAVTELTNNLKSLKLTGATVLKAEVALNVTI